MNMRTPPYGTPLAVIEVDRRTENQRLRDDRDRLSRQLRQARERYQQAFDDGFRACLEMIKRGATMQRLEAATHVNDKASIPVELSDSTEITQVNVMSPFFEGD